MTFRSTRRPLAAALPAVALLAAVICGALAGCRGEPATPAAAPAPPPPACAGCSLVLISIDTLRADHLGTYGYTRDTSPHLDALASRSVVFERAYSTSYHTADSHMSLFTGLHPSVHRVQNAVLTKAVRLADGIPTLPQVLQTAGYRTVGFHGGGNVSGQYGFDRGFNAYRPAADKVDGAVAWLEAHGGERFFLFFHTYRTHDPYTPDPPYDRLFLPPGDDAHVRTLAELKRQAGGGKNFLRLRDAFWEPVDPADPADLARVVALYDGEIRQVDEEVHGLLAAVARHAPGAVVVVTSDHGEEFQEHGRFLHDQLYDELLHVPLLVALPGGEGRRVASPVSLVDLAPTLLDLLALPPLPAAGPSFRGLLGGGGEPEAERDVFAEKLIGAQRDGVLPRNQAVLSGPWKLILFHGHRAAEFYDRGADPGERRDLGIAVPQARALGLKLRAFRTETRRLGDELNPGGPQPMDDMPPETLEQLRALGYLQ